MMTKLNSCASTKAGPPAICSIEAVSEKRGDTKETGQDNTTEMCRLPFGGHDKGAVVNKGQRVRQTGVQSHKTRSSGLSDQMESTQPGFVGQLKGKLTKQRYKAATVFVDHFSSLHYIYMTTSTSSNEAIKAKLA